MSGRPEVPFAPVSYLRDRAWAVILGVFCVAFLAFMLGVLGLGPHAIFVCAAFVTLCLATMLAWGYLRRRRWYRELFSLLTSSLSRDYRIVETPLAQVCRESIKSLANLLIDSGVGVQVDIGAQVRVQTDASWLRFVLRQVLSNAAQYGACTVGFSVAEGPAATRARPPGTACSWPQRCAARWGWGSRSPPRRAGGSACWCRSPRTGRA